VYALPLTERELNYMQRNKSPNDASGTLRPVRNSAKLSSRENRMSEKPTIQKELNNSIGKPVADRYGAFTDRYGHRRTRTIGEPLERRDWGGLGSARERSGSRNGERSGIQTDRVGNLTSRDGSSSKLYRGKNSLLTSKKLLLCEMSLYLLIRPSQRKLRCKKIIRRQSYRQIR
jgi:hypothetical protein